MEKIFSHYKSIPFVAWVDFFKPLKEPFCKQLKFQNSRPGEVFVMVKKNIVKSCKWAICNVAGRWNAKLNQHSCI